MKVYERTTLEAKQFTPKTQEDILTWVSLFNTFSEAIYDEDGDPAIELQLDDDIYIAQYGSWIIVDIETSTIIEVLPDELFDKKYERA